MKPCSHDMTIVEVHPAHMWDCPHCGTENFHRSISIQMTPDELREQGIEEDDIQHWEKCTVPPCVVTCKKCGSRYRTTPDHEDGEDASEPRP